MTILELAKLLLGDDSVEELINAECLDMAQRTTAGLETQIQAAVFAATHEACTNEDTRTSLFEKLLDVVDAPPDVRAAKLTVMVEAFLPVDKLHAIRGETML